MIVSFSLKYKNYQRKIRNEQIERAQKLIDSGKYKQRPKNQNDPHKFIARETSTKDGEICSREMVYLNAAVIQEEEFYDGFYAVCTNLDDMGVDEIVRINKKRWEIEECFRIMKTDFKARPGEKMGYTPVYTRTDLTDALHETTGFRTDYQIITDVNMRKVIHASKKKK